MPAQHIRALVDDDGGRQSTVDLYAIVLNLSTDDAGRFIVDLTGRCRKIHHVSATLLAEKGTAQPDFGPLDPLIFRIQSNDETGVALPSALVNVMVWVEG